MNSSENILIGACCTLLVVTLGLVGCRSTPNPRSENETQVAHAVHSERLRALMLSMQRVGRDQWPQELDAQDEWARERQRVRSRLEALASAAGQIPSVLDEVDLPQNHRLQFKQLAENLQDEVRHFILDLDGAGPEDIRERFSTLQQRCHECHRRYKVLPLVVP